MKVLVTGASGFIGRHLVSALTCRGDAVRALVRNAARGRGLGEGVEFIVGDLGRPDSLAGAAAGVDAVVHLGAAMDGEWAKHVRVTVRGTAAMLAECRRAGVGRFVHVSSLVVHDAMRAGRGGVVTERTPMQRDGRSMGAYARGKRLAERLVRGSSGDGLSWTVVRPGLVYGPGRLDFEHLGLRLPGGFRVALGTADVHLPLVSVYSVVEGLLAVLDSARTVGGCYLLVDKTQVSRQAYARALAEQGLPVGRVVGVPCGAAAVAAEGVRRLRGLPGLGFLPGTSGQKMRQRGTSVTYDACALERDTPWRAGDDLQAGLARALKTQPGEKQAQVRRGAVSRGRRGKWRVGLLGAGENSVCHLQALQRLDNVEVVGVVDPRAGAAKALAARFACGEAFEEARLFYDKAQPDAVHVVTPPGVHAPLAVEALGRGVHVLCEKPMATTVQACDAMLDTAHAGRAQLMVNHNMLFDVRVRRALGMVQAGAIGELVHVDTTYAFAMERFGRGGGEVQARRRLWVSALGGGLLEDLLPHALSCTLGFVGFDAQVGGHWLGRTGRAGGMSDELRLSLANGGVTGQVTLTLGASPSAFLIRVLGTKGTLEVDVQNMVLRHDRLGGGPKAMARGLMVGRGAVGQLIQLAGGAVGMATGRGRGPGDMSAVVRLFYEALEDGALPTGVDGASGRRVVSVMREIWPTAEDGLKAGHGPQRLLFTQGEAVAR